MARIISHPFRLENGAVATVDQADDQAMSEQLAVLVLTRRGERLMVPLFGVPDPAFQGLAIEDVIFGVSLFGPPVRITDLRTVVEDATSQRVTVTYDR